jgi:hypothetical protein
VEALIARRDVPIDPVSEAALGVDLDLDGQLGQASRVAYGSSTDGKGGTPMHWVGRARAEEAAGRLSIAPGMYPLGTELFHTVRYLDVGPDGVPAIAARMKEVRYAKKVRWESERVARANAIREARDQEESIDGTIDVHWQKELGVYNGRGWLLQGFIEGRTGNLRPQTYDEMATCAGCHGGIGATTDFTFALPRKMDTGPARGWFHWSQKDLRGLPEPRLERGRGEYATYLGLVGGGDDYRSNQEVASRFFDERGALRADMEARLRDDVSSLLVPSAERALSLDRTYRAIVLEQSFEKGRDAVVGGKSLERPHIYAHPPLGEPTGIGDVTMPLQDHRGPATSPGEALAR